MRAIWHTAAEKGTKACLKAALPGLIITGIVINVGYWSTVFEFGPGAQVAAVVRGPSEIATAMLFATALAFNLARVLLEAGKVEERAEASETPSLRKAA